jgi:hypothetical protein
MAEEAAEEAEVDVDDAGPLEDVEEVLAEGLDPLEQGAALVVDEPGRVEAPLGRGHADALPAERPLMVARGAVDGVALRQAVLRGSGPRATWRRVGRHRGGGGKPRGLG